MSPHFLAIRRMGVSILMGSGSEASLELGGWQVDASLQQTAGWRAGIHGVGLRTTCLEFLLRAQF